MLAWWLDRMTHKPPATRPHMWKASQACNPPTWIVDMDRWSMLIGVHILKHHFSIEFNSFITLAWNFPFSYLWSSQCDALATGLLRRSFSPAWAHCSILGRLCGAPTSFYQLRPVLSFLFHPSTFGFIGSMVVTKAWESLPMCSSYVWLHCKRKGTYKLPRPQSHTTSYPANSEIIILGSRHYYA